MAGTIRASERLLTIWGGFVAKPGLLSGLKAGADTYDVVTKLAKTPDPSLKTLGERLADEAETVFRQYRDAPPDAEVLYAQMVEKGLPDAQTIAGANLNAGQVVDRMLEPVLAELFGNPAFFADIEPAAIAEILKRQDRAQEQLDQLVAQYGNLATAMESLTRVPRDQLEALALRFEIEGIYDHSDANLRQVLEKKAEEYRDLKAEVVGLKGLSNRIDNIHTAALDAVERLDLEQASRFVADACEIQTQEVLRPALETNAKLMETEAHIALMRNRPDLAFKTLSSAADSFAQVASKEPARRRSKYQYSLWKHAVHFGGAGFELAEYMVRDALGSFEPDKEPKLFGELNFNLANALQRKGLTLGGQNGEKCLNKALTHYGIATEWISEFEQPEQWARIQENLKRFQFNLRHIQQPESSSNIPAGSTFRRCRRWH